MDTLLKSLKIPALDRLLTQPDTSSSPYYTETHLFKAEASENLQKGEAQRSSSSSPTGQRRYVAISIPSGTNLFREQQRLLRPDEDLLPSGELIPFVNLGGAYSHAQQTSTGMHVYRTLGPIRLLVWTHAGNARLLLDDWKRALHRLMEQGVTGNEALTERSTKDWWRFARETHLTHRDLRLLQLATGVSTQIEDQKQYVARAKPRYGADIWLMPPTFQPGDYNVTLSVKGFSSVELRAFDRRRLNEVLRVYLTDRGFHGTYSGQVLSPLLRGGKTRETIWMIPATTNGNGPTSRQSTSSTSRSADSVAWSGERRYVMRDPDHPYDWTQYLNPELASWMRQTKWSFDLTRFRSKSWTGALTRFYFTQMDRWQRQLARADADDDDLLTDPGPTSLTVATLNVHRFRSINASDAPHTAMEALLTLAEQYSVDVLCLQECGLTPGGPPLNLRCEDAVFYPHVAIQRGATTDVGIYSRVPLRVLASMTGAANEDVLVKFAVDKNGWRDVVIGGMHGGIGQRIYGQSGQRVDDADRIAAGNSDKRVDFLRRFVAGGQTRMSASDESNPRLSSARTDAHLTTLPRSLLACDVLAGDMNAMPQDNELEFLRECGFRGDSDEPTTPFATRVDYLLARRDRGLHIDFCKTVAFPYSDHAPVIMRMRSDRRDDAEIYPSIPFTAGNTSLTACAGPATDGKKRSAHGRHRSGTSGRGKQRRRDM